jgi:hypothetical protein
MALTPFREAIGISPESYSIYSLPGAKRPATASLHSRFHAQFLEVQVPLDSPPGGVI